MMECVSVQNMRKSDQQTIERGIAGIELIHRAALGVYHAVEWKGKIAILTGSGNNGADGFALAEILHTEGFSVTVFKVSDRMHEDCAYYAECAVNSGVEVASYCSTEKKLRDYDMIVDCMLGTGFCGALREQYEASIHEINRSAAYVVSVDINSGMNGDTGEGSTVVHSDLTVAIQFVKRGMVTPNAGGYIKRLVCVDIGIELADVEDKICNEQEWSYICDELGASQQNESIGTDGRVYLKCPTWLEYSL